MPVSEAARAEVRRRSRGLCELFHEAPVEGDQIVHSSHQGMGGAAEAAECNDPSVLLWGCQECHNRLHGPGMPWQIVKIDLSAGVLEIVDEEMRRVDHERIFFHNGGMWFEAMDRYPRLVDSIRRRNEAEYDLARELAFFKPTKNGPELFRVCPEVKQMRDAGFRTFVSLLGMTWSTAKELIPVGEWAEEQKLDELMRGIDIDALDALRKVPEEEMIDFLGKAQSRPAEFWNVVDRSVKHRHGRRSHYLQLTPDGKIMDIGLHEADPETEEAFGLIKGVVVRPNDRVMES